MLTIGIIMDPIEHADPDKDTTITLMHALQKKCNVEYIIPHSIFLENQNVFAKSSKIKIFKNKTDFYKISKSRLINLNKFNCLFFRLDPPVDNFYIQITHLLDYLEKKGVLIINSPQSIRDMNEKILGNNLTPNNIPTLISSNNNIIKNFIRKNRKVVLKPLNMMRGENIIVCKYGEKNLESKISNMLCNNKFENILVQKYINDIKKGDTRIIIYNGIVHDKVLVRFPPKNDFRANLAIGGKYKIKKIDNKYVEHLLDIAEYLRSNRIYLAGVDMIGKYITEINITSPTGIQQLESTSKDLSDKIASEFIKIIKNFYLNE